MSAPITPAWPLLSWNDNGKSYSYTVTPTDREWFIRCLWREGKPAETVGHVLLQRFALLTYAGAKYATLTDFLRAYCQPVNPRWFPGGNKSEAFIKRAIARGDTASAAKERDRAKQRVTFASTPISAIRTEFVQLADKILSGRSQSPAPTATHFTMSFAAPSDTEAIALQKAQEYAKSRNLIHVPIKEGQRQGVNWFFRGAKSPPAIRFGTTTAKAMTAVILLPWGLLIWWYKRRRR
jgi:hypothetical protein